MIVIDELSSQPVFSQIQSQISGLIRAGALTPGQKLPSVRQLAKDIQVAAGTVMRAYTELEADGLIETRAGSAARVRSGHQLSSDFREAATALITTAHQQGMSMAHTLQAIQALWTDTAPRWPATMKSEDTPAPSPSERERQSGRSSNISATQLQAAASDP